MKKIFDTPHELLTQVGEQLGVSEWLTIDQERINQFAAATGDHQWIHVDPERAKAGPFGKCIAHGYLTMSLVNYFMPQVFDVQGIAMGINYGSDKVRFPAPVPVDSKVRGSCQLVDAKEVGDAVQITVRTTVELEGSEKPACVVDSISRYHPA